MNFYKSIRKPQPNRKVVKNMNKPFTKEEIGMTK